MTHRLKIGMPLFAIVVGVCLVTSTSIGQDVGPVTPTEPAPPVTPTTPADTGNTGGGSATTSGGDGTFDPDFSNVEIEISENTRNQGFIGATSASVQELGFIGVASDSSGPPLAEGASFGGGVNSGGGGGGRAGGTTAGGRGQAQGFGAAGQLGFPVVRRNLRSRLRPSFTAPPVSSEMISSRFNSQFYRLPEANQFSGQFQVSIANRTATLTGSVRSKADSDRLVRQLRLEPGVYSIDNQLKIVN